MHTKLPAQFAVMPSSVQSAYPEAPMMTQDEMEKMRLFLSMNRKRRRSIAAAMKRQVKHK